MEITHLVAFNIALFVAMLSPGPALLLSIQTSVSSGVSAGRFFGLGLACMAAAWTGAALLGLAALFAVFPLLYTAMRVIGAGYLLYLAWNLMRHAKDTPGKGHHRADAPFLSGLLVNLGNPKSVLFAGAIMVTIFPPDLVLSDKILIVANHLVIEVLFYSTIASLMNIGGIQRRYIAARALFNRIAGTVLALLGLRILFAEGVRFLTRG